MTFTPGIPATGQSLGVTKNPIMNNFLNYSNLVSVDHLAPNNPSQGQHKQVTLNTIGSSPFSVTGSQSYIFSQNADASGASGTQLVYQPSVVNYFVPCTVRALARVVCSGNGVYALGNDPYGNATSFNVASVASGGNNKFQINFSNALTNTSYFVMLAVEITPTSGNIFVVSKATNNFQVSLSSGTFGNGVEVVIMVY